MEKIDNKFNIDDVIFEGKNKEYGAYELRKFYSKRLFTALLIVVVIILGLIILPKEQPKTEKKYKVDEIVLSPLKKIKELTVLKETIQQTIKETPTNIEPVKEEIKNETKLKIVEEKEKQVLKTTDEKKEIQPLNNNNNNNNSNQNNSDTSSQNQANSNSNNGQDDAIDAKAAKFPIIFPGCEKYTNDPQKLYVCFNNKMRDEVNYHLSNADIKKKSKEELYFEIDKNGDINGIKHIKGDKINDAVALGALKKISLDYNKRTNPLKRIKPARDDAGRSVTIFYKIPITFEQSDID